MVFDGYEWWIIAPVVVCIIVMVALLIRRLKHYLRKEKEEWYEIFLLLQIEGVERKNVSDVKAAP